MSDFTLYWLRLFSFGFLFLNHFNILFLFYFFLLFSFIFLLIFGRRGLCWHFSRLKELVKLFEHFLLALCYFKLVYIQSNRVGLAAALFQIILVNVGTASPPASIHHLLVVIHREPRRSYTPRSWPWILFLALTIAASFRRALLIEMHINDIH